MDILYIHRTQSKGVEGVHINETVKALTALGNSVDIVSPAGINHFEEETNANSYKTHGFISKFLPEFFFEILEIGYNFIGIKRLNGLLHRKKYAFIYERYAIFNWSGIIAAKKYNIPIILEVNYTSSTPIFRKRSKIFKPLARWLDKIIFKEANGLITVSTYLKEHLINLGVESKKITILTNAADPIKFDSAISGDDVKRQYNLDGKNIIGFIGGFYPWHGLEMLLDSFARLKHNYKNAVLLLVGDGPTKADIIKKIERLNLKNDVLFAGKIQHNSLPRYIAAFDIAVMPNSNNYGSPMKIYEYMSMGKPVVAPRLGPLEDVITDGKEGILFESGNTNKLTAALGRLLGNESLCKEIGAHGKNKILLTHNWKTNAEKILMIHKSMDSKR